MTSDAVSYFPKAIAPEADETSGPEKVAVKRAAQGISPLNEISDEKLLKRVGKGDRDALSVLFRRHARAVFSVACRILRDESEAEDLVQELFLFVFQKASVYDPAKSSGASWIIQMAYHRAIDRKRYLGVRHHYTSQEIEEERLPALKGKPSIDGVAARTLLEKFRGELSAEQRQTLEMHLFEGYSFHEIAERTGQSFTGVRHHYYRGLERLRQHVFAKR
ncbi:MULTISPECIES: sigma-70 family RNA polymerase sigma factor [Acidobacterium]|uniref:RNA polymerase sigma-70 factor n=1 Tax=Acidobacterium capsulatum (strain ATCC 51196 / DSM 11244 / BCRC 80197 / JCM 7670 / NBRC 15755 / NCIMB 13165 / 161) TaxID=240015 RepID=C1F5N6_ACIC5|nr:MULTISPECIES: sigma-70 family RNA polymerase sigma factor [Acidobacterium]ACO34283.1 RNA polymerase sigma-70 factor [Acidobacterium capsulatum ATCC 51196]HCT60455.1 hypothetical protein [Acidobacterium sp.]